MTFSQFVGNLDELADMVPDTLPRSQSSDFSGMATESDSAEDKQDEDDEIMLPVDSDETYCSEAEENFSGNRPDGSRGWHLSSFATVYQIYPGSLEAVESDTED